MPIKREHRWQKPVKKQERQFRFAIQIEPDQEMLQEAWQRSGMKEPFREAMNQPALAYILKMMARQGTKTQQKEREALGGMQ